MEEKKTQRQLVDALTKLPEIKINLILNNTGNRGGMIHTILSSMLKSEVEQIYKDNLEHKPD